MGVWIKEKVFEGMRSVGEGGREDFLQKVPFSPSMIFSYPNTAECVRA